jgi:APA family basic amino acid/polyamine antiporter
VSGGTYEYGYRFLRPILGFAAGWMFLVAKSASAAAAAIGLTWYLLSAFGSSSPILGRLMPVVIVVIVTSVAATGLKRSAVVNSVIVTVTIGSLLLLVGSALPGFDREAFTPFFQPTGGRRALPALLYAAALSFVAFTGYGRIATLGEEIRDPQRSIPRAIAATVVIVFALYVLVASSSVSVLGSAAYAEAARVSGAPLEFVAFERMGMPGQIALTIGAAVALLGVLLNLILGLSRVLLAMGRRGDMPGIVSRVSNGTPRTAVIVMGIGVAALTLVGDIRLTWSFSAVTVLIYYALTNLSALRLSNEQRSFPRWVSVLGLIGCLLLAAFVDPTVVGAGGAVLVAGLIWHVAAQWLARTRH